MGSIEFDLTRRVLLCEPEAAYPLQDQDDSTLAIHQTAARERSLRPRLDFRPSEPRFAATDLALLAQLPQESGLPPGGREALLLKPDDPCLDLVRFWVTARAARAHQARLMFNEDEAFEWASAAPAPVRTTPESG